MYHDIESSAENFQNAHNFAEECNEDLQVLDERVRENFALFIQNLREKIKENRRNKVNIKTGMNEAFKYHQNAIETQKEKIELCKRTYDLVDKEVNKFDDKLQKYTDNKEEARENDGSLIRMAFLQKRKRRKYKKRRHSREAPKPKERDSVEQQAPMIADYQADPSEPRYCYCHRVAFGRMVACDGESCEHEWFHFVCVGLTEDPAADWYCESCQAKLDAKNRKSQLKTPKTPKRAVESDLSPVKKKINPRKSLSELKRENVDQTPTAMMKNLKLKTPKTEVKTPLKKIKNGVISRSPSKTPKRSSKSPKKEGRSPIKLRIQKKLLVKSPVKKMEADKSPQASSSKAKRTPSKSPQKRILRSIKAEPDESPKKKLKTSIPPDSAVASKKQLFKNHNTPKRSNTKENIPSVSPLKMVLKPVNISINLRAPIKSNESKVATPKVTFKPPKSNPKQSPKFSPRKLRVPSSTPRYK